MARQSPNRPEADEPPADKPMAPEPVAPEPVAPEPVAPEPVAPEPVAPEPLADEPLAAGPVGKLARNTQPAEADAHDTGSSLWEQTRIAPVEIALPGGVGFTLRAYRLSSELTPTDVDLTAEEDPFDARQRAASERAAREDDDNAAIGDDEFTALVAEGDAERQTTHSDVPQGDDIAEPDPAEFTDEPEDKPADEEVPIFLSHRGRLLAFKSPESLAAFVRSGAPHDMAQLDTWATVAQKVRKTDIAPSAEDSYELDLVVENLRGGHDTWDLPLLIAAGEIARDLGYALRLKPVILALAPGSPLDDLDDSLRSASNGGVSGFLGKRRLRKIGAQQASLGWRSIIGKISAAVDWRD